MVAQYIVKRPIMELWKAAERKRGAQVGILWWENEGIELAGAKETSAAATEVEADKDGLEE